MNLETEDNDYYHYNLYMKIFSHCTIAILMNWKQEETKEIAWKQYNKAQTNCYKLLLK